VIYSTLWEAEARSEELKAKKHQCRISAAADGGVYKALICNRVICLIRKDKEDYQNRLVRGFKSNPKRFYGYIYKKNACCENS